jgi:hypothetical protein
VVLPPGFSFISSNVAAQLSTTADGRLKPAFANPSGQSNPVTIHARTTTAKFPPTQYADVFFDDTKTLYDLDAPDTHLIKVDQSYSDYRKGASARLDSLEYLKLQDMRVIDLDIAKVFTPIQEGKSAVIRLEVPISCPPAMRFPLFLNPARLARIRGARLSRSSTSTPKIITK